MPALNQKFFIIVNTSTLVPTGVFANAPGGIFIADSFGDTFSINYADSDPNDPSQSMFNDISLTYLGITAVPEPSTWLAACFAAAYLLWKWKTGPRAYKKKDC